MISQSADLNPITGLFGLQVGLDFVPELLAAVILTVAGVTTAGKSLQARKDEAAKATASRTEDIELRPVVRHSEV